MITIKIKREDLPAKRSGVAVAAQRRKAGRHADRRSRRSQDARRTREWRDES